MTGTSLPRRLPPAVAAALLLFAFGAPSTLAAPDGRRLSAAEQVRALEAARAQALLQADTTALSRMIAPEFVEISRFAQVRTKADNLHDIATGDLKLTSVKYDSLTVQLYGNVAV